MMADKNVAAAQPADAVITTEPVVDVAVAVIVQPDGKFLLARRPPGKPYAGYWEFPGGKVEPGERVEDALKREILEELGVHVEQCYRWITQVFTYPHATVKLNFYRVVQWRGEPHPHEGQELAWQTAAAVDVAPLLPANAPVLRALALPAVYGITHAAALGEAVFMQQLQSALENGLRLIQVREKQMPPQTLRRFSAEVVVLAKRYGAQVLLNSDVELAREIGADGVHLTAHQLMQLESRPDMPLCAASCHNREELTRAAGLGLDFVVLGPVLPTPSHPDTPVMGWQNFSALIQDFPLPVYALGGLNISDIQAAWQHGAHGVAMLRGAW